jgi:hypothetical protein
MCRFGGWVRKVCNGSAAGWKSGTGGDNSRLEETFVSRVWSEYESALTSFRKKHEANVSLSRLQGGP